MAPKNITSIFGEQVTAIAEAPATKISAHVPTDYVVVVLSTNKTNERVLPRALEVAHETDAELVIIHTYKSSMASYRSEIVLANQQSTLSEQTRQAERYLKSIQNKLQLQYSRVSVYLHEGDDMVSALRNVANDWKNPRIILATSRKNWVQHLLSPDIVRHLKSVLGNHIEVEEIVR